MTKKDVRWACVIYVLVEMKSSCMGKGLGTLGSDNDFDAETCCWHFPMCPIPLSHTFESEEGDCMTQVIVFFMIMRTELQSM